MRSFLKRQFLSLTATALLFAALTRADAQTLYGTTAAGSDGGGGNLFSTTVNGTDFKVLHSFQFNGIDGMNPQSGVISGNDGKIYGVTANGGSAGNGTIYSYDTAAGTYQKLAEFNGSNGSNPFGQLLLYNHLFYGLTSSGGANGVGVLFSYDPVSATLTDLVDLDGTIGNTPYSGLTLLGGKLYFVTTAGGVNGGGTLAAYDPVAGTAADLFDLNSGDFPVASLVVIKNLLYGAATAGGVNGSGYLFSFDPSASSQTDIYDFSYPTGISSSGISQYDGMIYGTAVDGGSDGGGGALFSFNPVTSVYSELYAFDYNNKPSNGGYPSSTPLITNDGLFLGVTGAGGANSTGVLFSFDLLNSSNKSFRKLVDFDGTNGANPYLVALLSPAPPMTGTTAQTIHFADLTKTYGGPNFNGGGTASSGLPIVYSSSDLTVATPFGHTIRIVGAGTCTITASQPGNAVYAAAPDITATLTVKKAPLTITADNKTVYQNDPLPDLTISYTGFVYGDSVTALTTLPVINTTATSSAVQTTFPITVSGAAANNYTINYQDGVLTVVGLQQLFTLTDSVRTYGDPDFAMVTSSAGLPVTYTVDSADIATVSSSDPTLVHITGAGRTRVIARQSGNAVYAAGTDTVWLLINQAPLTITANDATIIYEQSNPVFIATYKGFVNGEDVSALTVQPVVTSTAAEEPPYPGTYLTEAYGAVSKNYVITYVPGVFTVTLPGDSLHAYCSSPGLLAVNVLSIAIQKAQVTLYSLGGQRVLSSELSLQKGFNGFSFPVSNLAAGIYIVRIEGPGLRLTQKIKIK